jgi:hypothetical protein
MNSDKRMRRINMERRLCFMMLLVIPSFLRPVEPVTWWMCGLAAAQTTAAFCFEFDGFTQVCECVCGKEEEGEEGTKEEKEGMGEK